MWVPEEARIGHWIPWRWSCLLTEFIDMRAGH